MPIPNSASATYPAQAEPDALDFDILQAGLNGTGVMSGCACTPASSGSTLGVAVASGTVVVAGTVVAVTGATVTPGAASGSNPRFDLVVSNSSGTLSVIAGTAAATPVFPAAAPATYAVLAAVYIPTSATSITASNIVDKRQMLSVDAADTTPSLRRLGTGASMASKGTHDHAGNYASTAHGSTHSGTGSDPVTSLGAVSFTGATDFGADATFSPTDGTGTITFNAQTPSPAAPPGDGYLKLYARWMGYRPVLSVQSLDREMFFGSMITGPEALFLAMPNNGTTLASAMLFSWAAGTISGTSTPTASHPAASSTLGYRTRLSTAATAGSDVSVFSADARWIRGDSVLPWCGYYYHARVNFPDASYNNTTATTGSRMFFGMTDQTATTMLNTDDPAGNRHGFQRCNVNGGKTQTNFFLSTKNGTTEALLDTGVALVQNNVYDFYIFVRPGGGYAFGQIFNLTAGTGSGALIDVAGSASVPTATTFMRATAGLRTINAVARNMELHRVGVEIPA